MPLAFASGRNKFRIKLMTDHPLSAHARRACSMAKVIIIGNNVAGTTAAKGIRDADPEVEIDIYTDEGIPYYPRPRLIEYIIGTVQEKDMPMYGPQWYEQNRIRLHLLHKAEKLNRQTKQIMISAKWQPYDKLVLATGSRAFVPPLVGLPKENVFALRNFEDAKRIKEQAARSTHAVIIGGGLLGLETARAVCTAYPALYVTILESGEHLLMRQLDHEGADLLQSWIEATGSRVLVRAESEELLGDKAVEGVALKDGREIKCDMVVLSAGTRANVNLAKDAGLKVNKGIVVDSSLRTSDPNIFAIGDACEYNGRVWAMINPAIDEAKVAARKILDLPSPDYQGSVPSNTLKVVGFDLTSIGQIGSVHETPIQGHEEIRAMTPDRKVYRKFVLQDGKLVGAILLGTKKDIAKVTKLIKDGAPVEEFKDRLSDPYFSVP